MNRRFSSALAPLASMFAAGAVLLGSAPARAHFILDAPASWMSQDSLGSPQKLGPCGDEGGGTQTGDVTAYHAGDTIQITIEETIFHPGHYRVAIALDDPSELPAEPPVTAADTPCGSTTVENPAVYPVLADGLLTHTDAFSGKQTVEVKIPEGITCDKCTLQIIEFMSDHGLNNPGGCFYHHCANIKVTAPVSSGSGTGTGGATSSSTGDSSSSSEATGSGGEQGVTSSADATSGAGGQGGHGGAGGAGGSGGASSGSGDKSGCSVGAAGDGSPAGLGLAALVGLAAIAAGRRRRA